MNRSEGIWLLKKRMGGVNRSRKKNDAVDSRRDSFDGIRRSRERRDPHEQHGGDIVQRAIERVGRGEIAAHDVGADRNIARLRIAAEGANRETGGTQLRDDLSPDIAARAGDEDPPLYAHPVNNNAAPDRKIL